MLRRLLLIVAALAAAFVVPAFAAIAGSEDARRVEYEAKPRSRHLVAGKGLRLFMRVAVRLRGGVLGGIVLGW